MRTAFFVARIRCSLAVLSMATACQPSTGTGDATSDSSGLDGNYEGTMGLGCPDGSWTDRELVLTVRGGLISVSKPEPGSGAMTSDGKATFGVDDHFDTSSAVTLTGLFQSTYYGSSGAGQWVEHHADGTCNGRWSVSKF